MVVMRKNDFGRVRFFLFFCSYGKTIEEKERAVKRKKKLCGETRHDKVDDMK